MQDSSHDQEMTGEKKKKLLLVVREVVESRNIIVEYIYMFQQKYMKPQKTERETRRSASE